MVSPWALKSCLPQISNKLNKDLTLLTARLHDKFFFVSIGFGDIVHGSHTSLICNQHIPSKSECTKLQ